MPKPFAQRVAESVDHPIEAAFACRPRGTILTTALSAGFGAAIGSIVGGTPLWAGIGGGGGALLGYLIVWLRLLGSDQTLGMAIALTAERLELYRLSSIGARPTDLIRAIPYSEITGVDTRSRWLEFQLDIATTGEPLKVDTSKRGVGAGGKFLDDLRRRIAA
jgi:hypothetical protein